MGKRCTPNMLDAALAYITSKADKAVFCSAEPTSYAEANVTYKLGEAAVLATDFYAAAAGTVSGRKLTMHEMLIQIDTPGNANHVALLDSVGSELLYVTTCTAEDVLALQTWLVPEWSIELRDPA